MKNVWQQMFTAIVLFAVGFNSYSESLPRVELPMTLDENYFMTLPKHAKTSLNTRAHLHELVKNKHQKQLTEKEVRKALSVTNQDPNNPSKVVLFYSQRSVAKSKLDQGGKESDQLSWEHIWPASHSLQAKNPWAYTDLHHIRLVDKTNKNSRRDFDFGEGGTPQAKCDCKRNMLSSTTGTWEPPDAIKGDVARMLFYMDIRYEGDDDATPDLELVNKTTQRGQATMGKLCTLLKWHEADPPGKEERFRNYRIESIQGNRNPFITQPELADIIWGNQC